MSGVATAAIGVAELGIGIYKGAKAKSEAKKLAATRPTLSDSPYLRDQLSLAESQLSTGMSAEAKATYEQDMDRSLSASLASVLKGGGNPNNVGEIFASDNQGRQRLAIMKDNLRLADIDRVSRAQDAAEEIREKQFGINEDAPWKDSAQANAAARQGAENEIWSGVGLAGSGIMKGIEGMKSTGDYARASSVNTPLAKTSTPAGSPAAGVNTINPTSAPNLLDTLLATNPT
jgi:hypothetical protein